MVDTEQSVERMLKNARGSVVVDVGSADRLSTNVEGGLHLLVDPEASGVVKYDENVGRVSVVKARAEDLGVVLNRKVDRVQIICPDPGEVEGLVYACVDWVKPAGVLVVAFDLNSNKRSEVPHAKRSVQRILQREGFKLGGNVDLEEMVEGMPNSEFVLEDTVVGRKVR